jgi:hypothetical protein
MRRAELVEDIGGRIRAVAFVVLMCLGAYPAFADDLATSFEQAVARAEAQEHAASTEDYFTNALLPFYAKAYAPVLQSCFAAVPKPDDAPFAFVAALGADGRVQHFYRDRETNISLCLRDAVEKGAFPRPPVSPYYLHIEMKFTNDGSIPSESQQDAPPLVLASNQYSYTFGVPANWEFSFEQAQERGARLAFFPQGGNFSKSSSVVYISEVDENCTPHCLTALSRAIAKTMREVRDESPAVQIASGSPVRIKEGGTSEVRILTGARDPRLDSAKDNEALAFIAHNETIILVILTARDTKTWQQDYAAFQEIVSGHRFFTCSSPSLSVPCHK